MNWYIQKNVKVGNVGKNNNYEFQNFRIAVAIQYNWRYR